MPTLRHLLCLFFPLVSVSRADDVVYVRRETREASRQASIEATRRKLGEFEKGPWMVTGAGHVRQGPNGEVDPAAAPAGSDGKPARWEARPDLVDGRWAQLSGPCWLYRTIESGREQEAAYIFGSEAFVNTWFNGVNVEAFGNTKVLPGGTSQFAVRVRKGTNRTLIHIGGATPFYYELSPVGGAHLAKIDERLDADFPAAGEQRYYRLETAAAPEGVCLEVGGLAFVPRWGAAEETARSGGGPTAGARAPSVLMISTRRGEIWRVDPPAADGKWTRYASGLHEALGICRGDAPGEVFVIQRPELTRVRDTDGDGVADRFETIADAWGISGQQHEYLYGAVRDRDGNFWGAVSGLGDQAHARYLGWSYKVTPAGAFAYWSFGLRSSNGVGVSPAGDVFIADNQGEWVGTSPLHHVTEGAFHGHPVALIWRPDSHGKIPPPKQFPPRKPAALLFPYGPMGQSLSQPLWDTTEGKFGPFAGQLFVGDQTKCTVMRATLEKVGGEWQGACYPFRAGFQSGNNRLCFGPDGTLWVGQTDRGWGAIGGKPWGLQRLAWTGETPMEIHAMSLTNDGFDLAFTKEVDPAAAGDPAAYSLQHYHYLYHGTYGSPQVGNTAVEVKAARVSPDRRRVSLVLPELATGRIYELHVTGLRAADGSELLHPTAYYTLNRRLTDETAPPRPTFEGKPGY